MGGVSDFRKGGSKEFRQIVDSFLLQPDLSFASVLSAERIERVFQKHDNLLGIGRIYSTVIVLWSFLGQVLRDGNEASSRSAVARVAAYQRPPGIRTAGDTACLEFKEFAVRDSTSSRTTQLLSSVQDPSNGRSSFCNSSTSKCGVPTDLGRALMFQIYFIVGILSVISQTFAFEVGDTVVAIHDAKLRIEGKTGGDVWPGMVLKITAIKGKWVWVRNSHPGWLEEQHVVPLSQATSVLTDLIHKDPSNPRYHFGRGTVWMALGEFDSAIADFKETNRLYPHCATYGAIAAAWFEKNEYGKAITNYNEALRLVKKGDITNKVIFYKNRGDALSDLGVLDSALSDYNEAILLDPCLAVAYSSRAECWWKKKQYDLAIRDCDQAIKLDPMDSFAYLNRGRAWSCKGECSKANADFEIALRLEPKSPDLWSGIARCLSNSNDICCDRHKAIEYATKACELTDWKKPYYLCILAATYAESGNFEKAVEFQTKALAVAPEAWRPGYQKLIEVYKSEKPYRE